MSSISADALLPHAQPLSVRGPTPGLLKQRIMGVALPIMGFLNSAFLFYLGQGLITEYPSGSTADVGGKCALIGGAVNTLAVAYFTWVIWTTPTAAFG